MSPTVKNYLIVLLTASTVSAGWIAWQQGRRLSSLQEELLKASSLAVAKPQAGSATSFNSIPLAEEPAAPADAPAEAAAAETEARAQNQRQRNNRPNFAALMANPEFAQAMSVQQRAALDNRYADLFKQLNLSPEQLEQFKALLVERQSARMDVMAAARESGLNARENRDELRKLTAEAQAEVDASIKSAIGETAYNQYQNYEATQSQRNLVSQLDQRLSYSATALNSTQTEFLVNALAASSSGSTASQSDGAPGGPWGGGNRTVITDTVIQQAQSVLTSDQVAALKQLQSEQQAQQKVREMMRSNNSGGDEPPDR